MSKARMYGKKTGYVPNAKADMRHHKKVYQRGRERCGPLPDRQAARKEAGNGQA